MKIVKRLHKGDDLMVSIKQIAQEHNIEAGVVLSSVGCLTKLTVRCADGKTVHSKSGRFEILSINGTVSKNRCHLHIAAADKNLTTYGGHLCEESIVNTTCELVIETLDGLVFDKEFDENTGYNELVVKEK